MGAMITFMRIMAKYGCEKVRNGIGIALCAYWKAKKFLSFPFSGALFFLRVSFFLFSIYPSPQSSFVPKAKHKNMCINL